MSAKKEEQKQFVDGRCAIAELLPYVFGLDVFSSSSDFCPTGIPRVVHVVNKLVCHFPVWGRNSNYEDSGEKQLYLEMAKFLPDFAGFCRSVVGVSEWQTKIILVKMKNRCLQC